MKKAVEIDLRAILRPESIYVKIGVAWRKRSQSTFPWRNPFFHPVLMDRDEFDKISTVSANSLLGAVRGLSRNRHILVLGTGGAEKFMLTRYLFLTTARDGDYVPVLLDKLDEVKEQQFTDTVRAVKMFCVKYPENLCVMTARLRPDFAPPETFTVVESMPLNAEQTAKLAGKL